MRCSSNASNVTSSAGWEFDVLAREAISLKTSEAVVLCSGSSGSFQAKRHSPPSGMRFDPAPDNLNWRCQPACLVRWQKRVAGRCYEFFVSLLLAES
jgi:hypothetical protein